MRIPGSCASIVLPGQCKKSFPSVAGRIHYNSPLPPNVGLDTPITQTITQRLREKIWELLHAINNPLHTKIKGKREKNQQSLKREEILNVLSIFSYRKVLSLDHYKSTIIRTVNGRQQLLFITLQESPPQLKRKDSSFFSVPCNMKLRVVIFFLFVILFDGKGNEHKISGVQRQKPP